MGRELAAAVVAYGFGTLDLPRVHATVAAPNTASLRVLAGVGFVAVRDIAEDDGGTTHLLTLERARGTGSTEQDRAEG
ncbi:GNAT family N-acetyltransferase [Pseudonocardia artemisiae]